MNRRGFLGSLAAIAATLTLDPEKLLWRPGEKTIFVPAIRPVDGMLEALNDAPCLDPCFEMIDSTTLAVLRRNLIYENLLGDPALMKKLRSGSADLFSGGKRL